MNTTPSSTSAWRQDASLCRSVIPALIFVLGLLFVATQALAAFSATPNTQGGGFTGPGPGITTVEQAKKMADDAPVTLRGRITASLGGERYTFQDATGTIQVEIDDDDWGGQNISPADPVEIRGEVSKEWNKLEIDVKTVIKQ